MSSSGGVDDPCAGDKSDNDSESGPASSLVKSRRRFVVEPHEPSSSKTEFVLDSEEYEAARDVLYSRVGEYGKWQRNVFIWASLVGIPAAWHMLAVTFFAPPVDHWCAKPDEMPFANWTDEEWKLYAIPLTAADNGKHDQCHMYDPDSLPDAFMLNTTQLDSNFTSSLQAQGKDLRIVPCKAWDFDRSVFQHTISEQWGLVCDKASWPQFIQATYMVGVLVGCVVYGYLSDRIGRRSVIILGTVQLLISGLCCSLAENLPLFILLRFLVAMGTNAQFTVAFVLIMELIGGKKRKILSVAYEYAFSLGFISLAGIAFLVTDWRFLELAITAPVVLLLIYVWVLPESPRWLISEGRLLEAQKIIDEIAEKNGRSLPEALRHEGPDGTVTVCVCGLSSSAHHLLTDDDVAEAQKKAEKELSYTFKDLFEKPGMRKKTMNIYFCWFVNAFVYYGLSLNAGNLGGNVFVNVLLAGLVEIPAYIFSIYVLGNQGRRNPLCFSMILGGAACLLTIAVPRGTYLYEWPIITMAMIGKFGISASFAIIYVYSGELYPTVVRKVGVNSSSMCAKVGSILAPFVRLVGDQTHDGVPLIIFGVASVVAGLLALLLPETHKRKLPETLEEGEKFGSIDEDEEKQESGRPLNGKLQQSKDDINDAESDEDNVRSGGPGSPLTGTANRRPNDSRSSKKVQESEV